MALVTRSFWSKQTREANNNMHTVDGNNENRNPLLRISSSWKRIFRAKSNHTKGHWVPSISGMIKAGDEGLSPNVLFAANLHGYSSLQGLYETFAQELRTRTMYERAAYTGDVQQFLSSTRRVANAAKRVQSMSHRTVSSRRSMNGSTRLHRKSLDFSVAERGLARTLSVKRPTPELVPVRNGLGRMSDSEEVNTSWTKDGQLAEFRHGFISVRITPVELAALCIILGTRLAMEGSVNSPPTIGTFNISVSTTTTKDHQCQVVLRQHKRDIAHMPARGSGFSSLYAKHFAAGSLPYNQARNTLRSILIDEQTFVMVQAGLQLQLDRLTRKTAQSQYLTLLPSSREIDFHIASPSTRPTASSDIVNGISILPFAGGLVPLASDPLIKTVQFMASGGLAPGRLLQRLEGLVDKVNRFAPQLNLFGALYEPKNGALLYRERERLGRLATGTNVVDSIADQASRMQRYTTLLERLMALIPGSTPEQVVETVYVATRKELESSYREAVAAHQTNRSSASSVTDSHGCPESDARSKRLSTLSQSISDHCSEVSVVNADSPISSIGHRSQNLGKQVEKVLKAELPFAVETVALVARLIIVAWTLSVQVVAWEEEVQGYRVPDLYKLPEKMLLC
ncbi:hypothetical protein ACEQ8H_000600 [Pleosporales sp. CAS-2024a]